MRVVDAGLIGLCLTELPLVGLTLATPLLMAIFTLNPVVKVLSMDGAVVYIPKRTLAMSVYLALAESTGPAANTWPEGKRNDRVCHHHELITSKAAAGVPCAVPMRAVPYWPQ